VIRTLLVSVWILSAALASAYVGATVKLGSNAHGGAPGEEGPLQMTLKAITVPVIANGVMQGYVLAQLTLSLKRDVLKTLPQPPELVVADFVFKTIYAEEQVDFKRLAKQDLDKLSKTLLESVNARAGGPLVENVYIQELHYLNKQEAAPGIGAAAGGGAPHH
jgi:hypothetical protein